MIGFRLLSRTVLTPAVVALCAVTAGPALAVSAREVLPPASAVKGWKAVGQSRVYTASNLFDLINGEAESILAFQFVACAHGEYAPAGQTKPVLTIDVYQMKDPLNAFGVFGSDRQSGKPIAIGAEGVNIAPSGINFWKGPYVVRTAIVQVNPANQAAQQAFARAAAGRIPGDTKLPGAVLALPAGRQPRSEKYVAQNVAGQSFITNAVTARYPAAGLGAELFIAQYPGAAQAKAALAKYRQYETKNGTGLAPAPGLGDSAFKVADRYAKNVVVAQKGKHLVGMVRAREAAGALRLVRQALGGLR